MELTQFNKTLLLYNTFTTSLTHLQYKLYNLFLESMQLETQQHKLVKVSPTVWQSWLNNRRTHYVSK